VIILTRLGGHEVAVNPDLIERAEPTPDTVLTMVDGHKIVVAEGIDELVALIRDWRASVVARVRVQLHEAGIEQDPDGRPSPAHRSAQPGDPGDPGGLAGLAEQASIDASLARVLRLPRRGE
jgi:flagellar protein FlbD